MDAHHSNPLYCSRCSIHPVPRDWTELLADFCIDCADEADMLEVARRGLVLGWAIDQDTHDAYVDALTDAVFGLVPRKNELGEATNTVVLRQPA